MEYYKACLLLGSICDTIGFNNGKWEFDDCLINNKLDNLKLIKEFKKLGGMYDISLKNWYVSDDTLLMLATGKSLLNKNIMKSTITNFIELYNKYYKNSNINRYFGYTTISYIKKLKKNKNWQKLEFNKYGGGSGCSMRMAPIGLFYHKPSQLENLAYYSICNSLLTHTHPLGYLGGFVTALFTSYSIQKIEPEKWIKKLIDIFKDKNNIIIQILTKLNKNDIYTKYSGQFIKLIIKYYQLRFKNGKYIETKEMKDISFRFEYFTENFEPEFDTNDRDYSKWLGGSGIGSIIYAYDSLILAKDNIYKLILLSALHCGDNDTTGIIAGCWYGSYYGMSNIPNNLFKHLELIDENFKISTQLYKNREK
jgi:ADP-ribosylarginine hydrolase